MSDNKLPENKISFKDTLNLPKTEFPIRSTPKIEDPAMIARWEQEKLYQKAFIHNQGNKKFILHDGPPYANGHLHMGHAYNNVLKDIVTKSQRMFGHHVPVTPGWDCHGLPIELKVSQENPGLPAAQLKKACRAYAQKWIEIQKQERKNMGVIMNWSKPYATMDFEYEAKILQAFGQFVEKGYIERKSKTVPWCPSCATVLASAEIEYEERKDPSIYVLFPLTTQAIKNLFPELEAREVSVVVWTTTPWTLPLNRAVLAKPQAVYEVFEIQNKYIIVAKERASVLRTLLNCTSDIYATVTAEQLAAQGKCVQHPFVDQLTVPLLLDQSVSTDDGTAFVHCAPGCGPEDYEVGIRNNLEIYSPVDKDGLYTKGIVPVELEGMKVADGQIWVIKKLAELNRLLYKTTIKHSYPHCWRCHGGLIFRATKQWFCDLSRHNLKQNVLAAADTIATLPEKSINRLKATLEGRLEWCLSRQRIWGVPIPSFICINCDYTYITPQLVEAVAQKVKEQGIEYWDYVNPEQLLPENFVCPACDCATFKKEQDILDVWFDSGVSHYAVLLGNNELGFPADMYLEGKDQHRGWFQSSLLTSMVLEEKPAMRMIVTHGFTVDEKGRKMSKSLGNVVTPDQMIEKIGTDGMRLWVSSIDLAGEAVISDTLMQNVQEVFRKIRNTCRFLLSNLYDFDIDRDAIAFENMRMIDQYALQQLYRINDVVLKKYAAYDFTAIFHVLADYCAVDLSAFYLDIIKDRLYVEKADGFERKSAQTACWYILDTLTKLIAPILSFTAETISDHYQKNKKQSIHLQSFATLQDIWKFMAVKAGSPYATTLEYPFAPDTAAQTMIFDYMLTLEATWQELKLIRGALLKAIEGLREAGNLKHSLEAKLILYFDPASSHFELIQNFFKDLSAAGQSPESFFKEYMIVSQVEIAPSVTSLEQSEYKGLFIRVEKAQGVKCPRCWQWEVSSHEHGLCGRCSDIV